MTETTVVIESRGTKEEYENSGQAEMKPDLITSTCSVANHVLPTYKVSLGEFAEPSLTLKDVELLDTFFTRYSKVPECTPPLKQNEVELESLKLDSNETTEKIGFTDDTESIEDFCLDTDFLLEKIVNFSDTETILYDKYHSELNCVDPDFHRRKIESKLNSLKTMILSLEAKVEVCLIEIVDQTSSPIQDDENLAGASRRIKPLQDDYEISPDYDWMEMRRLEEKVGKLIHVAMEKNRMNLKMEEQMQSMKHQQNELQHENTVLQERQLDQLFLISLLKSQVDEDKYSFMTPRKSQAVNDKIKELLEANEKQVEINKKLMFEKQEICGDLNLFKEIIRKKDSLIALLQDTLSGLQKEKFINMEQNDEQLEKLVKSQANEAEALQKFMQLKLVDSEDIHLQTEQWRTNLEAMQKNHNEEVGGLRRQIQILCRQLESGDTEDIDIADVQREIMEASSFFGAVDYKAYGNLVYFLVKKAIDSKLSHMARKHKVHIDMIEKTWEQGIKNKLFTIKKHFKHLKKSQAMKNDMLGEFQNKIAVLTKLLRNKQEVERIQRQTIERLHEDLESQLKKEKLLKDRHKVEMSDLNELFEKRWLNKMKIQVMQVEELKKLKDSKEKTVEALCNHLFAKYEEKLKALQDEYALKIEEEGSKEELKELQLMLERRFEKEKKQIAEMKEKETRRALGF